MILKKIILVLIMLITSFIVKPLNGDIVNTNENVIKNTITEEQIISSEDVIKEKEIEIQPQTKIVNAEIEKNSDIKEQRKEENVVSKKEPSNNNSNHVQSKQEQPKVENKQEQPKDENKQEKISQIQEEPVVTQPIKTETQQKQEEKIYCVDGGKIHIYGDGANEHGYYKTWEEAFNAYEEYTKGWESTQFKIDQCACGLYYFWVIK